MAQPSVPPGNFGQAEDHWFGRRDEEAESAASKSLAATAARIVGAKPFPIAAKRLEELTRSNSARIEQVVTVLESDPALSARLLRLVNSAGYGLKVRCTSVRHAAVLVGTRRLNQVATTAAILDLFETSNALATELLEHATIVGSLCRYLAVHLGLPHDELFTCGFLHDIGKIMLLDTEREIYPAVLQQFGGKPDRIHEQERLIFGFDHATLGAHVLTAWNIPDPVPKVIAWHHQPSRALQDSLLSAMVQTLRLSDLLAYELGHIGDEEGIALVAASEAARYLDISEPQLAAMWKDLCQLGVRSRARSHGEADLEVAEPRLDVPNSLRPRRSLAPKSLGPSAKPTRGSLLPNDSDPPEALPPAESDPARDVPTRLPCVVCGTGSYGNLCHACGGHVCPNHQVGSDEWCALCAHDFEDFRGEYRLPLVSKGLVSAVVSFSLIGSVASAWSSANGALSSLFAPGLLAAVWGIVLPIAWKSWVKLRFMRQVTPRTAPNVTPGAREQLRDDGSRASREVDSERPLVPSVLPTYERPTIGSPAAVRVTPPIEPFAVGLAALLPSSEDADELDRSPDALAAPTVIRVEVPSLSADAFSMAPRSDAFLPANARAATTEAEAEAAPASEDRPLSEPPHAPTPRSGFPAAMEVEPRPPIVAIVRIEPDAQSAAGSAARQEVDLLIAPPEPRAGSTEPDPNAGAAGLGDPTHAISSPDPSTAEAAKAGGEASSDTDPASAPPSSGTPELTVSELPMPHRRSSTPPSPATGAASTPEAATDEPASGPEESAPPAPERAEAKAVPDSESESALSAPTAAAEAPLSAPAPALEPALSLPAAPLADPEAATQSLAPPNEAARSLASPDEAARSLAPPDEAALPDEAAPSLAPPDATTNGAAVLTSVRPGLASEHATSSAFGDKSSVIPELEAPLADEASGVHHVRSSNRSGGRLRETCVTAAFNRCS